MGYAQFKGCTSRRSIEVKLIAHDKKLYHSRLKRVSKSSLVEMNVKYDWHICQEFAMILVDWESAYTRASVVAWTFDSMVYTLTVRNW